MADYNVYEIRQKSMLKHIASMLDLKLPDLPDELNFKGTGFQLLPYIQLNGTNGVSRKVMAHVEGGFWMAKMHCERQWNYDDVIRRLLLIKHAEEVSGKPRYIEVSDFMVAQLLRMYCLFKNKVNVSSKVWVEVEQQLLGYEYATFHEPMSENHKILHLSSELCMVHLFPEEQFYDGFTGKEKMKQVKKNIIAFLEKRLKYGWSEFDSTGYYNMDFVALLNIYDLQPDEELKRLAWKTLHFLLVDLLHHSTNGYVGGAKGRVKVSTITSLKSGIFWPVYVCTGFPETVKPDHFVEWSTAFFATSHFRPDPALRMLASKRDEPYEVKERNVLYSMPDDKQVTGSIKRYHYVTSDYVLGSITQRDTMEPYNFHNWLNGHQELSWSLVFADHPEAVIFSSHPGHEGLRDWGMHGYWTGDTHCLCHRAVQSKSVLLGMNIIRNKEQLPWIHFYIPRHAFDEIREQYGWLLLKKGDVITAIKAEPGYYWTTKGEWREKELIVPSAQSAFAVEVVKCGILGIDDWMERFKDRHISFQDGTAEYTALNGSKLELHFNGPSKIDGAIQDYSEYPKFDSKYIYSGWGDDQLVITDPMSERKCRL